MVSTSGSQTPQSQNTKISGSNVPSKLNIEEDETLIEKIENSFEEKTTGEEDEKQLGENMSSKQDENDSQKLAKIKPRTSTSILTQQQPATPTAQQQQLIDSLRMYMPPGK
jgi:hypothetical protein